VTNAEIYVNVSRRGCKESGGVEGGKNEKNLPSRPLTPSARSLLPRMGMYSENGGKLDGVGSEERLVSANKYVASILAEKEMRIIGTLGAMGRTKRNIEWGEGCLDDWMRFNILTRVTCTYVL